MAVRLCSAVMLPGPVVDTRGMSGLLRRERSDNLHEILTERGQQLLLPRGLPPESRERLFEATRWMRDQPERRAAWCTWCVSLPFDG
jgi:hypothetical protein